MLVLINKYPKTSLFIGMILMLIIIVGIYRIMDKKAKVQKIELLEDQKEIEKRIREEATNEIKEIKKETSDSIKKILEQDAKIIYKPYKERVYIDRDIDSALIILQRTRYMVQ